MIDVVTKPKRGWKEIREKDYVLTPGRYIGLPDEEDDFDFDERDRKSVV